MISASSLLYNHEVCPNGVQMEAFADSGTRDAVCLFLHMLWKRGSLFEQQTIAELEPRFTDLSGIAGAEKEMHIREASGPGVML